MTAMPPPDARGRHPYQPRGRLLRPLPVREQQAKQHPGRQRNGKCRKPRANDGLKRRRNPNDRADKTGHNRFDDADAGIPLPEEREQNRRRQRAADPCPCPTDNEIHKRLRCHRQHQAKQPGDDHYRAGKRDKLFFRQAKAQRAADNIFADGARDHEQLRIGRCHDAAKMPDKSTPASHGGSKSSAMCGNTVMCQPILLFQHEARPTSECFALVRTASTCKVP